MTTSAVAYARHVGDEGLDARREAERRVRGAYLVDVRGAGLMRHVERARRGSEGPKRVDRRDVQAMRARAAAEDEETRPGVQRSRRAADDLPSHRIARMHGAAGREEVRRLCKADAHPRGETSEEAIGRPRYDVLLEQHDRQVREPRRDHDRNRRVATDTDHEAGTQLGQEPPAAHRAARHRGQARNRPAGAAAAQLARGQQAERISRGRHGARLDAARGADERHVEPLVRQRIGEREARIEVSPRAAPGDHHAAAPRGVRPGALRRADHPASRASASSTPTSASAAIIADPP